MLEVPQRASLVAQVAESIRHSLERHEWTEFLPPEMVLCEQLRVSRPTLRAALHVLQREGWIGVSQGKRTRIMHQGKRRATGTGERRVAVITPLPYHSLSPFVLYLLNELQSALHGMGVRLQLISDARFNDDQAVKTLESLAAGQSFHGWVLLIARQDLHRWFIDNRAPAVALGSLPPDVEIPSLGMDYEATVRHAAGVLLSRGHTHATILTPQLYTYTKDPFAPFCSLAEQITARGEATFSVTAHDGTVPHLREQLGLLRHARPRPTALIVVRPKHYLTVLTHLLDDGLRVPGDVSLICLSHEKYLDELVPSVAHYEINWEGFARRLVRMVTHILQDGSIPARHTMLIPEFHDGKSLGRTP